VSIMLTTSIGVLKRFKSTIDSCTVI
jgi:hypothetical protein